MMIDTDKIETLLNNKAIPAYTLEAKTGVSRSTIAKIRKNIINIDNLTLKSLKALQIYLDNTKKST